MCSGAVGVLGSSGTSVAKPQTPPLERVVRPDLIPVVTRLFEEGPLRFVDLPMKGRLTGVQVQRGVSGRKLDPESGVQEAIQLFRGGSFQHRRYVSLLDSEPEAARRAAFYTNSSFARPLLVRGRVKELVPGVDYVEGTSRVPADTSIDHMEQVALIPPVRALFGAEPVPVLDLAASYLLLRERLVGAGLRLSPNSRGERFVPELFEALNSREEILDDLRIHPHSFDSSRHPLYKVLFRYFYEPGNELY